MGARAAQDHIIILDGTMSSLLKGRETNAGLTWKLLSEASDQFRTLYYEPGLQLPGPGHAVHVIVGRGINRQIRRAYGVLARRYRPGDRVFLFGFSRGGYAARSLAGMIHEVGLLRAEMADDRRIGHAWRYYQDRRGSRFIAPFRRRYCQPDVTIEMIGVWDTVKALGIDLPLLLRLSPVTADFHSDGLCPNVRHGFQALALDETRMVFAPVLWRTGPDHPGHVEQMWFRGTHGDIGGHLGGVEAARPLANIPLVWMLERAETLGLTLPPGWRARFPCDPHAPSVGLNQGWGRLFVWRRARTVGHDRSEALHHSVPLGHLEIVGWADRLRAVLAAVWPRFGQPG